MEPLILYVDGFWNSPYAFSAYVCLKEKGVSFETREVNLHEKAQKAPAFRAKSVTARVPVLEQGDFRLSESSAIVEYLEDTFAPPKYTAMLPAAPRDRARARQIMRGNGRLHLRRVPLCGKHLHRDDGQPRGLRCSVTARVTRRRVGA